MKKILSYIFLALSVIAVAQVKVDVAVDTTAIRLGEQITYSIAVENGNDVHFPELALDSLKKVEVVEALPTDTLKSKLIQKYMLTSFDSGAYVIPSQKVLINNRLYKTDSLYIQVMNVPVDTLKQKLFHAKTVEEQPMIFDDYVPYLWYLFFILLAAAGIYFLIRKYRNREPKVVEEVVETIPPFELAKQRLATLDAQQLWQNNQVKEYYIELTDIIRSYIEKEIKVPALELTTDELIGLLSDFRQINKVEVPLEKLQELEELLKAADLVKFAKYRPMATAIEQHRIEAETVIDNLKKKSVIKTEADDVE